MAFEIYTREPRRRVAPGSISINADGSVWIPAEDLKSVNVADAIVVMLDVETNRIAFRKPNAGEAAFQVSYRHHTNGCGRLRVARLLARLKLPMPSAHYPLQYEGEMLVATLATGGAA